MLCIEVEEEFDEVEHCGFPPIDNSTLVSAPISLAEETNFPEGNFSAPRANKRQLFVGTIVGGMLLTGLTACSENEGVEYGVNLPADEDKRTALFEKGFGNCKEVRPSFDSICNQEIYATLEPCVTELDHVSRFEVESGAWDLTVYHENGNVPFSQEEIDAVVDHLVQLDELHLLEIGKPVGDAVMFYGRFDQCRSSTRTYLRSTKDRTIYSIVNIEDEHLEREPDPPVPMSPEVAELCQELYTTRHQHVDGRQAVKQFFEDQEIICNRYGLAAGAVREGLDYNEYCAVAECKGIASSGMISLLPYSESAYRAIWQIYHPDSPESSLWQELFQSSRVHHMIEFVLSTTPLAPEEKNYLREIYLPSLIKEGHAKTVSGLRRYVEYVAGCGAYL